MNPPILTHLGSVGPRPGPAPVLLTAAVVPLLGVLLAFSAGSDGPTPAQPASCSALADTKDDASPLQGRDATRSHCPRS